MGQGWDLGLGMEAGRWAWPHCGRGHRASLWTHEWDWLGVRGVAPGMEAWFEVKGRGSR